MKTNCRKRIKSEGISPNDTLFDGVMLWWTDEKAGTHPITVLDSKRVIAKTFSKIYAHGNPMPHGKAVETPIYYKKST